MADILPYLGVTQTFPEGDAAGREVVIPDLTGLTRKEAEKALAELSLSCQILGTGDTITGQIPAPGQTVPGGSQMLLYLGDVPPVRIVTVPDFTGMNRQQADAAAGALGLYILVSGNSSLDPGIIVTMQAIPAGTEVPVGTTIKLEFTDTKAAD